MARTPDERPSEKQLEVFRYLITFTEEHGYQPSQAEIAAHLGVTKNAVAERLKSLEHHGVIQLPESSRERAIRLKHVKFRAYFTRRPNDS